MIKHKFISKKPDGPDTTKVRPSDWNADHDISLAIRDITGLEDALSSVQGTPGPQGPAGRDGADGSPGARGEQGEQGIPGNDGAPGLQGLQGNDGAPGTQGTQGIPGQDGAPGTPGAKGDKGDTGNQGIQGLQGIQGIQGLPGQDGVAGPHTHPSTDIEGTAVLTNDARLSDARTPTTHSHDYEPLGYVVLANDTLAQALATNINTQLTVTAARTLTTTVPAAGTICSVTIVTSGTTSYVVTFGTGFKPVGTLATGTTNARAFTVNFRSNGTILREMGRTAAMVV